MATTSTSRSPGAPSSSPSSRRWPTSSPVEEAPGPALRRPSAPVASSPDADGDVRREDRPGVDETGAFGSVGAVADGVRRRAATTVSRGEVREQPKEWASRFDRPCHLPSESLFGSTETNIFDGVVNCGFLVLVIGFTLQLVENFNEYGVLVSPKSWLVSMLGIAHEINDTFLIILYSIVPVLGCLLVEKAMAARTLSSKIGLTIHVANLLIYLLVPIVVLSTQPVSYAAGVFLCALNCTFFMKLWSYVQVNLWCRNSCNMSGGMSHRLSTDKPGDDNVFHSKKDLDSSQPVQYPDNLSLSDLCYFIVAPTVCYELNFPRTSHIRKRFIAKRMLEILVGFPVLRCIQQQLIDPYLEAALVPYSNMEFAKLLQCLLRVAMPQLLHVLGFYYIMFHSFLNIVGELLQFADRRFYLNWWNSTNTDVYWRHWNVAVYRWLLRHLYIPLKKAGYTSRVALTAVFLFSGLAHEYYISVPLRTFKMWFLIGMLTQAPMSFISRWIEKHLGPRCGNMTIWLALVLGQPALFVMYYYDYLLKTYGEAAIVRFGNI